MESKSKLLSVKMNISRLEEASLERRLSYDSKKASACSLTVRILWDGGLYKDKQSIVLSLLRTTSTHKDSKILSLKTETHQ